MVASAVIERIVAEEAAPKEMARSRSTCPEASSWPVRMLDDRPISPDYGVTFPPICDIFAIRGNMYNIFSILSNIFPIFV